MIDLPDLDAAFEHENAFYLSCATDRVRKLLAQWEIFERAMAVPGAIVECGVFKGASLLRWAMFRDICGACERPIVGFDTFAEFPEAKLAADRPLRDRFVAEAGPLSISVGQLRDVLERKQLVNVELVAGDITTSVREYASARPDLRIALLHVDVDLYEPSRAIFESLYPLVVPGGITVLDDFGTFPGETRAATEALGKDLAEKLQTARFADRPVYLVKSI